MITRNVVHKNLMFFLKEKKKKRNAIIIENYFFYKFFDFLKENNNTGKSTQKMYCINKNFFKISKKYTFKKFPFIA